MTAYPELTSAVQPFEPDAAVLYTIDSAAHLSGLSRHDIMLYCKRGMIAPLVDPENGALYFDETALRSLGRIEYLRTQCGVNFTGIRIILELMQEVERLRTGA